MPKRKARKNLSIGATFKRNYQGKTHCLEVVSNEGKIRYRVGKELFDSPSGAAKAIAKHEVNGWVFWEIDS
jgi:hypothetical protein